MRVSGFVTKQDLMEPPGAAPPPSPLLWLLSAEYSLGRCTDAKATTRWTPFNYVPQTYGTYGLMVLTPVAPPCDLTIHTS